ncbi:hypothetical protein, partial [Klebsiella pneumoniae]|uniref:hypothetical protein n=1 Tax=Klebsiella pneumoniae TaxID=573 RepID=UPI00352872F8
MNKTKRCLIANFATVPAKVRQLYSDVIADFCAGQRPPAMFTYQTGGTYTIDTYELAIGMAQLDMATEGGNIYGVCPSYPFPNKDSGHCCKVSDEAAFCLIQRP